MRRGARGGLALAASVAALLGASQATAASEDPPSRLLVTGREYSLSLSRPKVAAGPAIVQLYDYGEDPHNLVLQRVGGERVFDLGVVQPGETGELPLRLKRHSRYRLWCSLADHAARGMTATLRTTRR